MDNEPAFLEQGNSGIRLSVFNCGVYSEHHNIQQDFGITRILIMDRETRITIIDHAIRWANNMVTEVQGNHAYQLGKRKRAALRAIVTALSDYLQGEPGDDKEEPTG